MLSWRLIPGVRGAGFVALVLRVALLGSRSARTCSRSSRAGRRIRRSGVSRWRVSRSVVPPWDPAGSPRAGCLVPLPAVFRPRHRSRSGHLWGSCSRCARKRSRSCFPAVWQPTAAGSVCSTACSPDGLCCTRFGSWVSPYAPALRRRLYALSSSTSFRLQSGGVGGRPRSTANRVRGGGADASSVPYSDGSASSVTACDRVLFSTRWGCPRRYRFRRRCRLPRRRVAAVRHAVWRPACSLRCAPGCGHRVRFRSARAPLYERRFRSGSTPFEGSFRRAVARTRRGVPAVVVRRGERLVVVAAACSGGRRFHLRLAGLGVALALEMSHLSPSVCPGSSRSAVASGLARRHVGTCDPLDANALAGAGRRLHPCARCVVFFGRCAQLFACGLVAGVLLDAVLIVPCVLTPKSGLWRPACCTPLYACVAPRRRSEVAERLDASSACAQAPWARRLGIGVQGMLPRVVCPALRRRVGLLDRRAVVAFAAVQHNIPSRSCVGCWSRVGFGRSCGGGGGVWFMMLWDRWFMRSLNSACFSA